MLVQTNVQDELIVNHPFGELQTAVMFSMPDPDDEGSTGGGTNGEDVKPGGDLPEEGND